MNTKTIERGTITIQHIFPAKGPGRSATIKDVDGMMFGYFPDKLQGIFDVGNTYDIEFTEVVKNGTTYRDITTGKMKAQQQAAPQAQRQADAPRATTANGNTAGQYNKNNYRQATPPDESEQMFVCNILGHFVDTGRLDCDRNHIAAAIEEIRAGYRAGFNKPDQH